jgi:hypothetical protein
VLTEPVKLGMYASASWFVYYFLIGFAHRHFYTTPNKANKSVNGEVGSGIGINK